MELNAAAQWIAFTIFAFVAVAGAVGMTTTMSMFRSGIFLMASFIGVAGLFLLLLADLVALLQVMMYVGGMLVMILFMVLFSHDPGGAMMAGMMKLRGPEWLFSLGLGDHHGNDGGGQHGGGKEAQQHGEKGQQGGMHHHGEKAQESGMQHHGGDGGDGDHGMSMQEMSMFTPIKKPALALAALVGVLLVTMLFALPRWPVVTELPDQDSARRIGHLLMGKYMIAFEGAGLLILLGIYGAVWLARPARHPDPRERDALRAAVDDRPAPTVVDVLDPIVPGVHEEPR